MTTQRARDLGIPFGGTPGPWNAITDVFGVEVGYSTVLSGVASKGGDPPAVRTGVTLIFPRGKASNDPVHAGTFTLNGAGEMTGMAWVAESGFLESPIAISNTHSIGAVHEAIIKWQRDNDMIFGRFSLPLVTETFDGVLNHVNGFHVREKHVLEAILDSKTGPVAEGNIGGGTGMRLFGWKGGSGTSSRRVVLPTGNTYTVGAFIQGNFGQPGEAIIAGVPVGRILMRDLILGTEEFEREADRGSIIVIIATDAPLLPHHLNRLAKRGAIGIARTGGIAGNSSGDIILAFSTANPGLAKTDMEPATCVALSNHTLDPFFAAVADATEEAIVNALVAADSMTGFEGHFVAAIPRDELLATLRLHGRLTTE